MTFDDRRDGTRPVRSAPRRDRDATIAVKAVGLADNRDVRRQQSLPDVVGACMPSNTLTRCTRGAVVTGPQRRPSGQR